MDCRITQQNYFIMIPSRDCNGRRDSLLSLFNYYYRVLFKFYYISCYLIICIQGKLFCIIAGSHKHNDEDQ